MNSRELLRAYGSRSGVSCCYEINGTRTVSIRDQMLRAIGIVGALKALGQVNDSADGTLLVAGAGAAGVAAAISAANVGVKVVLLEGAASLFQRQWSVTSRIIDPTEFDWPRPHWDHSAWAPASGPFSSHPGFPLTYRSSDAASVHARNWDVDFSDWMDGHEEEVRQGLRSHKLLETHCNVVLSDPSGKIPTGAPPTANPAILKCLAGHVEVDCPFLGWNGRRFAAVLSCVGHGVEKVWDSRLTPFRGPEFWATDTIEDTNFGVSALTGSIHVLVSGGGDGAQQDIHRALCGTFGRQLIKNAGIDLSTSSSKVDLGRLRAADKQRDAALRSGANESATVKAWTDEYVNAATSYWNVIGASGRSSLRDKLLRGEVLDRRVKLTWLLNSGETPYCYGLNRFLTELVLRAYASAERVGRDYDGNSPAHDDPAAQPIILKGHRVDSIRSKSPRHTCGSVDAHGKRELCDGLLHTVAVTGPTGASATLGDYHFVLLRHGLDPANLFGGAKEPYQLMPEDGM